MKSPLALPKDNNSNAVQALFPIATVNMTINDAGSTRLTLPADTELVRIAVSQDCYIKFGGSTVTATTSDAFFPVGAEVFACTDNGITHVAAFGTQISNGVLSASKMV